MPKKIKLKVYDGKTKEQKETEKKYEGLDFSKKIDEISEKSKSDKEFKKDMPKADLVLEEGSGEKKYADTQRKPGNIIYRRIKDKKKKGK